MRRIHCQLCGAHHTDRFLCDQARAILAGAIAARAEQDTPTVDFDTPVDITGTSLGLGPADSVFSRFDCNAVVIESGGAPFPGLIFTGRNLAGHTMPRWLYTSTAEDVLAIAALVQSRADLAVARYKRGVSG